MKDLYADITSLYHLEQGVSQGGGSLAGKADLGPLPPTAVALLAALAAAWALILLYALRRVWKKRRGEK